MQKAVILCEICDEPIVRADLKALKRPITAEMFEPLDASYSLPFPAEVTWEWFRCPYCSVRPFIVTEDEIERFVSGRWDGPEKVRTRDGFYQIGDSSIPGTPEILKRAVETHSDEALKAEWDSRVAAAAVQAAPWPETPQVQVDEPVPTRDTLLKKHAKRMTQSAKLG